MGHMPCVKVLCESRAVLHSQVCRAALWGNLEAMRYMVACGITEDREATWGAAWGLPCLQYAFENGAVMDRCTVCAASTGTGSVACLVYALDHGALMTHHAVYDAANHGNLECVHMLIVRGYPISYHHARCVQRNRDTILQALARRRGVVVIQRAWRGRVEARRRRAAYLIEDAYIEWACRPSGGSWYKRAEDAFGARRPRSNPLPTTD
ncbi:MAG: hypothetical protein WDW38_006392 [Sanguina aurantia]